MAPVAVNEEPALWSELLHALPAMAYRRLHDAQFTLLLASAGCQTITGYPPRALQDNHFLAYASLIHPEDRLRVTRKVTAALADRASYLCAYRLFTAGAEEKWVLDRGQGIFEENRLLYLEGVVLDNTERVATFQEIRQVLEERTRRLTSLYEIFATASLTTDLQPALDSVLRRTVAAVQADAAFLHLLEGDGRARLATHQGLSPANVRELALLEPGHPLTAEVLQTGRYRLLLNDDNKGSLSFPCRCCYDMEAYLGLPIYASQQIIGVFSLLSRDRRRFQAETAELLVAVSQQLGAMVERERLRHESAQLAIWEERHRLARELHDAVTQALYSMGLFAQAGRRQLEQGDAANALRSLTNVADIGQQGLKEMRLLLHKLRPAALEEAGLVRALEQRLETVEGRVGISYQLQAEGSVMLPPATEEAVYHICQEALNNALKHARATAVSVTLQGDESGQVSVRVGDDGRGFDVAAALDDAPGMGLSTMRERAEALGGRVTYHSALGEGTEVKLWLPGPAGAPLPGGAPAFAPRRSETDVLAPATAIQDGNEAR